jgi:hypothetical protein
VAPSAATTLRALMASCLASRVSSTPTTLPSLRKEHFTYPCTRRAPAAQGISTSAWSSCLRGIQHDWCVRPAEAGFIVMYSRSRQSTKTRTTSIGCAPARTRSSPSSCRKATAELVRPSPHALSRGKEHLSIRITSCPRSANVNAAIDPAGPAPTTATSASSRTGASAVMSTHLTAQARRPLS